MLDNGPPTTQFTELIKLLKKKKLNKKNEIKIKKIGKKYFNNLQKQILNRNRILAVNWF